MVTWRLDAPEKGDARGVMQELVAGRGSTLLEAKRRENGGVRREGEGGRGGSSRKRRGEGGGNREFVEGKLGKGITFEI